MSQQSQQERQVGANQPVVQKVGMPTAASLDSDMMSFINDITGFVPDEILQQLYGFANNLVGLAKFTPRQADAMILRAQNIADMVLISLHPWQVTPQLIIKLENFVQLVKIQVWRAETLDQRNERSHIATSSSITENRSPMQGNPPLRKKKFLGVF